MTRFLKILILTAAALFAGAGAALADEPEDPQLKYTVYAVESELAFNGDIVYNMYVRPFVYDGSSYIPLRDAVESMGGEVSYSGETNSVTCSYNGRSFEVGMTDKRVRVYDDVSFIKIRDIGEALGMVIEWYDGLIVVSEAEMPLTDEEVLRYKDRLWYEGYEDKYLSEAHYVVDPYQVYSYEQMQSDIRELERMHPQLITSYSIGKSVEGRDITAFDFGKGDRRIIMCGAMHAREYIATIFLMYLADRYAYGYLMDEYLDGYSIRTALDEVTFTFIPMMNPDGTNIVQNGFDAAQDPEAVASMPTTEWGGEERWESWKANANGVDLNRNYPIDWGPTGYTQPSSAGYAGPYENSEPETQAMVKLIDETDFSILASFHSQGEVIYWMDTICGYDLVEKFSPYIDRICDETGYLKMPATSDGSPHGFLTDYVRCAKRKMAMTIELCEYVGNYPYPEYDFDNVRGPIDKIGVILADISREL